MNFNKGEPYSNFAGICKRIFGSPSQLFPVRDLIVFRLLSPLSIRFLMWDFQVGLLSKIIPRNFTLATKSIRYLFIFISGINNSLYFLPSITLPKLQRLQCTNLMCGQITLQFWLYIIMSSTYINILVSGSADPCGKPKPDVLSTYWFSSPFTIKFLWKKAWNC